MELKIGNDYTGDLSGLVRVGATVRPLSGNWAEGTYKGHFFQMKVFGEPSSFGFENGRMSKLVLSQGEKCDHKKVVFSYDRGMDDTPTVLGLNLANEFNNALSG